MENPVGRHVGEGPQALLVSNNSYQSTDIAGLGSRERLDGGELGVIAVRSRSTFHSFDLELELQRRDIPFIKRGGFKFIETAHIKDVLAHLRVIANPADAVSWLRVLTIVPGVGHRTAERTIDSLVSAAEPEKELARVGQSARGKADAGFARLGALLANLRGEAKRPPEQLAAALEYYLPLMRDAYPDDFPKRERDLEHFQNITERYRSLEQMLADMALEPPNDSLGGVLASDPEEGYVTLSTIHSAKGLEWKVVFIIWAAEGRFPSPQSADPEELEEERRLMYVAVTRARRRLFLSHARLRMLHGQPRYGLPSRFLDDIPAALVRSLNLRTPSSADAAPYPAPPQASREPPYRMGARVSHPRYGEGVVSGYQGQGGEAEIKVSFPKLGDKWFLLDYVKLTPCG